MTFAHFQTPGNTPSVKDLLIKPVRIGAMTSEASFNKRTLSLSSPTALLDFKDLRALWTKFTFTLSRWNSKGEVLEVKTVETFKVSSVKRPITDLRRVSHNRPTKEH